MNKSEFFRRESRTPTGLYAVMCLHCAEIYETTNPETDELRSPCCRRGMARIGHLKPAQTAPRHPVQHEAGQQEALFRWVQFRAVTLPELRMLYHIPNGGRRSAKEAAHLKRQGVRPGVPDLCLPVARGKYHGLYIELKAGDNQPTDKQEEWLSALSAQGYAVAVCWSCEEAQQVLETYLCGAGAAGHA